MEKRNQRKTRTGFVVSNAMEKTVGITVERKIKHPVYGKYIKRTKKLHAHDDNNECNIGDFVKVRETRPLSKLKRWLVIEILEKAK